MSKTDKEMIEDFLKNNKATQCDEEKEYIGYEDYRKNSKHFNQKFSHYLVKVEQQNKLINTTNKKIDADSLFLLEKIKPKDELQLVGRCYFDDYSKITVTKLDYFTTTKNRLVLRYFTDNNKIYTIGQIKKKLGID